MRDLDPLKLSTGLDLSAVMIPGLHYYPDICMSGCIVDSNI
jgi:hypothetical protein